MEAYVYETTNLVNGRKYIGVHRAKQFDEKYKGSGKLLWQAIDKYGWDNFYTKVLKEFDDPNEALKYEAEVIEKLHADTDPLYYNICRGGGQGWFKNGVHVALGHKKSLEAKQKISNSKLGKKWICKGYQVKCVSPDELEKFLKDGWEARQPESIRNNLVGRDHSLGYIWITNGTENHMIPEEKLLEYENMGYWKECKSQKLSGRIRITDGKSNKMIYPKDFEEYERLGYRLGLTKNEPEFHLSGTVWINNEFQNKRVKRDKLQEFLDNGWKIGQLKKKTL